MADINITQEQADKLMAMEKKAIDQTEWIFPGPAERIVVPLTSLDKRENFSLDEAAPKRSKTVAGTPTFNKQARQVVSRKRVAGLGEVYTVDRDVTARPDLVKQETTRIESRFLEPATGSW